MGNPASRLNVLHGPEGSPVSEWLRCAREAADAAPARPRRPLLVAVAPDRSEPIGSIEPEIADRIAHAGLALASSAAGYVVAAPTDASLAAIAHWLHEHGLAAPWRDELLAVADASGRARGSVERAVVRVLGLVTEAVHLVGVAAGATTWVQQRALSKATDPGRWDTLMGGQVAAGESIAATLARETMEEAGLALADLRDLERCSPITIRRPVAEGYMVERIEVFRALVPEGVAPSNRDGEVERFDRLALAALLARLAEGAFTLEATLILGAELERRGTLGAAAPAG
jgi:8-oxo-dGTP pyrophosphatase MutT (NUDIX family)